LLWHRTTPEHPKELLFGVSASSSAAIRCGSERTLILKAIAARGAPTDCSTHRRAKSGTRFLSPRRPSLSALLPTATSMDGLDELGVCPKSKKWSVHREIHRLRCSIYMLRRYGSKYGCKHSSFKRAFQPNQPEGSWSWSWSATGTASPSASKLWCFGYRLGRHIRK